MYYFTPNQSKLFLSSISCNFGQMEIESNFNTKRDLYIMLFLIIIEY